MRDYLGVLLRIFHHLLYLSYITHFHARSSLFDTYLRDGGPKYIPNTQISPFQNEILLFKSVYCNFLELKLLPR